MGDFSSNLPRAMTEIMRQLTARKVERRRQLAALPVSIKLQMLEEMIAATQAICAQRPPKPENPVRRMVNWNVSEQS
jgi:hypothetical protein